MTVRVSKPAFNLREKLSELDVPIGTHGSQLMKSSNTEETFNLVKAGRRNLLINGQMWINQRNGISSVTMPHATGGTYQLDRWAINEATGGSVSVNMDGDPQNYHQVQQFERAMQIACASDNSSLASTENLHFFQNIEANNMCHLGWGTKHAKPVTLSFWVKTNCAGVYNVGLESRDTNRCCIRSFYQNGMHTWNKVVLHYSGCGDGTWNYGTGIGLRVRFCLASGTQYDDGIDGQWVHSDELTAGTQVNFMSSTNNRFMITGVQLEEGNSATPFEHRSYNEELALCQRYFAIYHPTSQERIYIESANATHRWWEHPIPAGMRTEPSITKGGTCSTLSIGIAGSLTINSLSVTGVDNGGASGTTHPGSMGNVSYRVGTTGTGGDSYSMRHTDGWQAGAGWINMDCEL